VHRLAPCLLVLLAGCIAPEVLDPRDGTVPPGVDFSGDWRIRSNYREDQRRLARAISRTDGIDDREIFEPSQDMSSSRSSRRGRAKGGLVYVFLETGEFLRITQTEHALFISFDRSVVEEFRFGEYRMVTVGAAEAQRATGWEGDALIVDTLDRNRMKMTDRFELLEGGRFLQRTITLRSDDGETESLVQQYARAD
jgi:hypothetical protein